MDGLPSMADGAPSSPRETADERKRRLAHEAVMIAVAKAQLAAGQGRSGDDLAAWLDAWESDGALSPRRQPQ
jgi:hypothetical protein